MFRAIKTACYRNLKWQSTAFNGNTKYKEQNSLTELITKINRKDGRIHANMANDMTDSDMVGTTISRNVGELVPPTAEQYMA